MQIAQSPPSSAHTLEQCLFVKKPRHRNTQVWHALSRDHTVSPATLEFIHKRNEPYLPLPLQPKLVLIYRSRGMEGWVNLGTTTVSKQSAQDRYMTAVTAVSCSDHHTSLVGCNYIPRWFTRLTIVTHPSINRARCWLTLLIGPTSLTTRAQTSLEHPIQLGKPKVSEEVS